MRRKLIATILVLVMLGAVLYTFKTPILRSCATALIHQDTLQHADAMFVLSGGAYDRGNEAAKVFKQGLTQQIICTGGNPFTELQAINIDTLESDMTVANLKRQQVPDSNIVVLHYGTSTREEADTIIGFCKQHAFKKVIVLSSLLHTGRTDKVLRNKFDEAGIQLILHGAPSSRFSEMLWWQSEDGLIGVNNEWIKTLYYWWKY